MAKQVILGGMGQEEILSAIRTLLAEVRPQSLGIAFAFVSVNGMNEMSKLLRRRHLRSRRFVAGTDYAITHPEALKAARQAGWDVRICRANGGVFHPKLIVGGSRFNSDGTIDDPSCAYIGSGNLTIGGLKKNVECAVLTKDAMCLREAAAAFRAIWVKSDTLTTESLTNYAAVFAKRNRERSARDIDSLGIDDREEKLTPDPATLVKKKPPRAAAFSDDFAAEVWAGLKSFTGDYALQVEFPKSAGKVLHRLIGDKVLPKNKVEVLCEDGETRKMTYRYYTVNSMYRLNIPNGVEGVGRARREKTGIALVKRGPEGGAPISLKLLPPGVEMEELVSRSISLGTWGRTRTRLYGWY